MANDKDIREQTCGTEEGKAKSSAGVAGDQAQVLKGEWGQGCLDG